jgi:hypothetical protein
MNADASLLTPYRAVVAEGVRRLLDGLDFGHAEPLRQAWQDANGSLAAPSLCLLTAEVVGGDPSPALPLATALALLEASVGVFRDLALDDEGASGRLQADWGMARVLNAGDAFFVLAQQSVLHLDASRALDAAVRFDAIAESCWPALASGESAAPALVKGAIILGALSAGRGSLDITPETSVESVIAGLDFLDEPKRRLIKAASNALEAS